MCALLLLTYDQHRDGRIVRTVIIVASYYQILVRIQVFQPGEDSIAFLKPGIASAVDAKRDETAFFQKGKTRAVHSDPGLYEIPEAVCNFGEHLHPEVSDVYERVPVPGYQRHIHDLFPYIMN